ncbi:MAG: polysaccharide deacetylase family protein [Butyricicoccus sp.]
MKRAACILFAAVMACGALSAALSKSEAVKTAAAQTTVRLPIAMYHSVTDSGKSPGEYVISPKTLESDLQFLQENGFVTVTVNDVIAYVKHGAQLPEKPVMLTFDDGYYNNYANAYPLLEKYGMRAVLSPVGTLTEQFTQADEPPNEIWSYCTEGELWEMADSGVIELQNHSYDFHELSPRRGCLKNSGEDGESYREIFCTDTQKAQEVFSNIGIAKPTCYTYPYGACNEETEELVRKCGLSASLGCEEGINTLRREESVLWRMKRYNRDGRRSTQDFWSEVLRELEEES